MKYLPGLTRSLLVIFFTLPFYVTGCNSEDTGGETSVISTDTDGSTTVNETVLIDILNTLPLDDLGTAESDGLIFMREEEKLAQRDIHQTQYLSQDDYDAIINADFETG